MQQYFQAALFLVLVVNSVLNVLWLKQEKQETKTAEWKMSTLQSGGLLFLPLYVPFMNA